MSSWPARFRFSTNVSEFWAPNVVLDKEAGEGRTVDQDHPGGDLFGVAVGIGTEPTHCNDGSSASDVLNPFEKLSRGT
jgi:hypothetical protein